MAKKKPAKKPSGAAAIEVIEEKAEEKGQRGKKTCPHCGESIGARCGTCPKCNKEIKPKTPKKTPAKKRGRKPATPTTDLGSRVAEIETAITLIEKLGGIESAKKKIAVVSELQKI